MMYELKGKVKSGLGNASFWVNKIYDLFQERYKMNLYLGTLNIELDNDFVLDKTEKIFSYEYGGEYDVLLQKCNILGNTAYIVRPEKNNTLGGDHPLNIIEIVSDKNLREEFNLKDNDTVTILLNKLMEKYMERAIHLAKKGTRTHISKSYCRFSCSKR